MDLSDAVRAQQPEKAATRPKLDIPAADLAVMKALDSTLKIEFKSLPMKDVLEYLEGKTKGDLNFILDEQGLKDAGSKDPGPTFNNDPVTKEYRKIKIRALLKILLGNAAWTTTSRTAISF